MRGKGFLGPVSPTGNGGVGTGPPRDGMNQLSFKKPTNALEIHKAPQTAAKPQGVSGLMHKTGGTQIEPFGSQVQQLSTRPVPKPDYSRSPQKPAPKKAPDRMVQSETKNQKTIEIKLTGLLAKNASSENVNLDLPADLTASEDAEFSKNGSSVGGESSGSEMKALKKEKKSLAYLLKVRAEIQKELDLRVANCRGLKKRAEELADQQQKLLPRLDRFEVVHQSELESLQ